MKAFFARHIVLTGVIVTIAGLFLVNAATGEGPSHTPEPALRSIERTLLDSYEYRLRQRLRARGGRGDSVAIVSLECAWTRPRRALCIADIAATGRSRRLVPRRVTIRVLRQSRDHYVYRVADA